MTACEHEGGKNGELDICPISPFLLHILKELQRTVAILATGVNQYEGSETERGPLIGGRVRPMDGAARSIRADCGKMFRR